MYDNGEFDLYIYRRKSCLTYSEAKRRSAIAHESKKEIKKVSDIIQRGIEDGYIEDSEYHSIMAESLGISLDEYFSKIEKSKKQSKNRAKNNIIELIRNNFQVGDSFVTLTFKDKEGFEWTNWNECVGELEKYFKRLKRKYGCELKYICIPELQKENGRNAWHYHILIDLKYGSYDFTEFNKIWGLGYVKVKKITSTGGIGYYLSVYLTECLDDVPKNKKTYFSSRTLKKPTIINSKREIEEILADAQCSVAYNKTVKSDYIDCEYLEFRNPL